MKTTYSAELLLSVTNDFTEFEKLLSLNRNYGFVSFTLTMVFNKIV